MNRALLSLDDGRRVPVEVDEVFLLEAEGSRTLIRTRGRRRLRDVRSLAEVLARFPPGSMARVHRSFAINPNRVTEIRRRDNGRDWELKLEPPVNRIIPISRGRLDALGAAYG
jgi:DNA-binding LytR/AlgR family response regulator